MIIINNYFLTRVSNLTEEETDEPQREINEKQS
jgi:hypothetical protein